MIRSPPASSLPTGALPSPCPMTRPSAKAIQPRSTTRSARTILALPIMVSEPVEVILLVFLSYRGKPGERLDDGSHRHGQWRGWQHLDAAFHRSDRPQGPVGGVEGPGIRLVRSSYAGMRWLQRCEAALFCGYGKLSTVCD